MALSEKERRIAVELKNYRRRKVGWCKLEKQYGMRREELKRLLCIYEGVKNNEIKK